MVCSDWFENLDARARSNEWMVIVQNVQSTEMQISFAGMLEDQTEG